ncbi:MAG: site-2 protease family protein [Phaeodactylibacter sp.]|nr:site-2 protease family protein [Phaeodactylibacter sp.]MCB9291212.1 site-2 protease family protein [Lewinellaceae bacterium]
MTWSLKIVRIAGINVYLHWTFLILLAWIFIASISAGQNAGEAFMGVVSVLALFACVVLHELGHALTARRFDIQTQRITLLPIGGLAMLEKMPEDPRQELLVALAGPAVNVVIAGLLFGYMALTGQEVFTLISNIWKDSSQIQLGQYFIPYLLLINVVLFAFNLIPAFPMDGGRVLRALLSMRYGRAQATSIAARIGQFLAIIFVFMGFIGNLFLIFIGLFIYLGATGEASQETQRSLLSRLRVRDVLMHQYTPLHAWETIGRAVEILLDGQEKEFIVTEDNQIIGTISRDDIIKGLQMLGREERIKRIVNQDWIRLSADMELNEAYEQMSRKKLSICPVYDESGALLGVLNQENILEAVMVESAREGSMMGPRAMAE